MSTGASLPFMPMTTVVLSSGTSSSNVQLPGNGEAILITNATSSLAYIRFGSDASVQATLTDVPVLPNARILLRCGPIVSYCAAVLVAGSGTVIFTRGDGSTV